MTDNQIINQLNAEVRALQQQIDALEKRVAAVEALMPKTMTAEELSAQRNSAKIVPLGT